MANLLNSEQLFIVRKYCQSCFSKLAQLIQCNTLSRWLCGNLRSYWYKSIRQQLILGIALVHAVLMTIFVIDMTERQRHFLQQESVQRSLAIAEMLAANSSSWVLASDVVGLTEILSYQMKYPGLGYALVTSMSGQVLAHTDSQLIGRYLTDESSQKLFIKTDAPPETQLLFQNEHYLDVAAPILASGKLIGWVKVGVSLAGVTQNLQIVSRDGLIYMILAILIGIIFAIIMANNLTAGLKQLLLAIERVKLGEREVRADETRLDEIGYLAKGLNAMIHAVKESDEKMKEAKQVAEAANIAKSQFIANMSHELRTPLNAIIGYSEMLQEEYDVLNPEEVLSDLGKINTSGKHLLNLINDVLDLSKIESGKMELFNETFDILKMVRNVISTVEVLVKQHHNQFKFYHDDKIGLMYGDLTKIRQVLLNLLSNASKFTENGIIQLSVKMFEQNNAMWVNFTISDNGIGIPEDKQQSLFQAFKQVDGSTTRKYGGTGLGLVISKRFVEMMGGTITLQSVLAQGTTFTVTLPIRTEIASGDNPPSNLRIV